MRIDFEYIISLLQGFVDSFSGEDSDPDEVQFEYQIRRLREIVAEFATDRPKLSELLRQTIDAIGADREKFIGKDISVLINEMRYSAIDREIQKYAEKWFVEPDIVRYEVYNYRDGVISNENKLKESADYTAYKESVAEPMAKFKFRKQMVEDFHEELMAEVCQLL